MNRQDYLREVHTLRASPDLSARIAALPRKPRRRNASPARWLSLAAALALVAGLGAATPAILRTIFTGGDLTDPPPASTNPSVPSPEGVIAQGIDVPGAVLDAARDYVQERYAYRMEHTGVMGFVDGVEQELGSPAVYDNWRIDGLSAVYERQELGDYTVALYRLDYRLHTTTPDRVVLAGPMEIDEDGWLLDTYPGGTYLVFLLNYSTPHFFGTTINDCDPGTELFDATILADIESYLTRDEADADATVQPGVGFTNYAAPVLPLTGAPGASRDLSWLTVDHALTFDFTDGPGYGSSDYEGWWPQITDRYTLSNTSGEEQYLDVFYPFAGNYDYSIPDYAPAVRLDGTLLNGDSLRSGRELGTPNDRPGWAGYAAALGGALDAGDYLSGALARSYLSIRDIPVHFYAVNNITGYEGNGEIRDPWSVSLRFDLELADPEHTQVFTYGFDSSGGVGTARPYYGTSLNANASPVHYLILVGGDLAGHTATGWQDGSYTSGGEVSGLTATLDLLQNDPLQSYLGGAVSLCMDDYLVGRAATSPDALDADNTGFEDALADYILSHAVGEGMLRALYGDERPADAAVNLDSNYSGGRMEDLIQDALSAPRVLYYASYLTISPGGSVTLECTRYYNPSNSWKTPSDEAANPIPTLGYDFSPTLGSNLPTDSLSVTIIPDGTRTIVNTNMLSRWPMDSGAQSITFDNLDPTAERYFFELK